jgi:O-antigen/teichoic acid export membrane protein
VFLGLAVVMAVSFQVDTLIVSSFLGAATAAQFSVTLRLFGLVPAFVQSSLSQLWPAFAEALNRGDLPWIERTIARSTILAGGVSAASALVLVLAGKPLIGMWLGPDFEPDTDLLVAAALWTSYLAAVHPLTMFLNGAQMQAAELAAAIPMAFVNVALSVLLTMQMGSPGPLIGSLAAHIMCAGIPLTVVARRKLRAQEPAMQTPSV